MALSGAFKLFDADNDVVKNIKSTISSGIWSGGAGSLTAFYSQSAQSSSNGAYYYDIYKTSPATDSEAEVQFSITYGHVHGSGSLGTVGAATGNRATAAIHAQFVNLLLGPNVDRFTYAGDNTSDHFYAISLKRARMREKVDPGNWELHLDAGNANQVKLIDDSGATTNPAVNQGGRVFNVVSGSIATGTAVINTTAANQTGGGYGLFYPDLGLLVLNAAQLYSLVADINTVTTSDTNADNSHKFLNSIIQGGKFQARSEEHTSEPPVTSRYRMPSSA